MAYSIEQYQSDKIAVDAAKADLSALVIGEKIGRTALYQGEYGRIAQYFNKGAGDSMRRIARMFLTISTANRISGFDCNIYSAMLDEVTKKIKSMRVFKRRPKIKCLEPRLHLQPCYCARLIAIEAAALGALSPIEPDLKEELNAKIQGALVLDKEFQDEA